MKSVTRFLLLVVTLFSLVIVNVYAVSNYDSDTVILSSKNDPYYELAEEISDVEGIPIYETLEEASEAKPVFLLWIAAPEKLSESVFINLSKKMANSNTISIGLITGKSIEDARRLWKGSKQIEWSNYAVINGSKGNKKKPEIIDSTDKQNTNIKLTKENILSVLQKADVIQVSLEGSAGSWFENSSGISVTVTDIPKLKSGIIQHNGCSTFRPWKQNSIALECISKGASAYCGFVFPSVAGTRFGDYYYNGAIYTWSKFPLGHFVQIQNNAAMQSYAHSPHYFMLGDPRIYCSSEVPYEVVSDEISDDTRTIELQDIKSGLIPIHIENGANYNSISILNYYSSMNSSYFNSHLQMININNDKYVLFINDKNYESITIKMHKDAPFIKSIFNNIISFFDSTIVYNQDYNLSLPLSLILLIFFTIGVLRKRYTSNQLISSFIFGIITALIVLVYTLIRLNNMVVSNIPIKTNWIFILHVFISAGYGQLLYIKSNKLFNKVRAVLIANLSVLITLIIFISILFIRLVLFKNSFSINKMVYPWFFTLIEFIVSSVIYFVAYYLFNRQKIWQLNKRQS